MPHPLVLQLRFTRSEFCRAVGKVSEEDALRRVMPMNSIGWTIGHLAWQEQRYFVYLPTGKYVLPEIQERYAFGAPHSTPPAKEMWAAWRKITRAADAFLDTLTVRALQQFVVREGKKTEWMYGNLLQRVIYHYWYHIGEDMAVRKMLGHSGFGYFVGDIDHEAPYVPERGARGRR